MTKFKFYIDNIKYGGQRQDIIKLYHESADTMRKYHLCEEFDLLYGCLCWTNDLVTYTQNVVMFGIYGLCKLDKEHFFGTFNASPQHSGYILKTKYGTVGFRQECNLSPSYRLNFNYRY